MRLFESRERNPDRTLSNRGPSRAVRQRHVPITELLEGRALLAAFTEFALPVGANPIAITTGPDNNLWFTESDGKIGRMNPTGGNLVEFPSGNGAGSIPDAITVGPDGNLWVTDSGASKVIKITPDGVTSAVLSGLSQPLGIAKGADGNLWFTQGGSGKVSKVSTAGAATDFPTGLTTSSPAGITPGPGGDLWFTDKGASQIARIASADGSVKVVTSLTSGSLPLGIVTDANNTVWFTESGANKIGTVTPAGAVMERALPTANAGPTSITVDRDGNLWFTERNVGQVGRISPSGVITEFATPNSSSQPSGITTGPDGNIWYTDTSGNKIDRIALDQLVVITGKSVSPTLGIPFTGTVASFTTASLNPKASNFSAKIDFGNGQVSNGVIVPNATGGYDVVGTTTYASAATAPLQVTVTDNGGGSPSIAAATVTLAVNGPVAPSTLTVQLDPASDTGAFHDDFITSDNCPTFYGKTANYAIVQVYALRSGSFPSENRFVGQTIAGPDGTWSLTLTTATLLDGAYSVSATATNPGGSPSPPVALTDGPGNARTLVIDTVGPRVTALAFSPKTGVVTAVISDAGAGLDPRTTSDMSNYTIISAASLVGGNAMPQQSDSISGFYTRAVGSTIVLSSTTPLRRGTYFFQIRSGGVRDLAGNALDGEFTSRFPSGDGSPGGNFIVKLTVPKSPPSPKPSRPPLPAHHPLLWRHRGVRR